MANLDDVFEPLSGLPTRLRRRVHESADVRHLPRGVTLFEQGGEPDAVFVVLSGRLNLHRDDCQGQCRTTCLVAPGDVCCCVTVLDGGPYPATATAAVDSAVASIATGLFRELFRSQPAFISAVSRQIGRQLRRFQCDGVSTGEVRTRITGKILAAADRLGSDVPLTRREIAELAGTTVETAIRETRLFEKAGWIALRRGHIRVLDTRSLRTVAGWGDSAVNPKPRARGEGPR